MVYRRGMTRWLVFAVLVGCVESQSVQCDFGLCPAGAACDDVHAACVQPEQLRSCVSLMDGEPCTIVAGMDGICDQRVCVVERCGDGYVRGGEQCDDTTIPEGASCVDLGFYVTRQPTCTVDCTFDRSSCDQECGDGIVQSEFEICDGSTPADSCVDYGFGAGLLGCVNCGPQTDRCLAFGWSVLDLPASIADIHGTGPDDVYALHNAGGLMHYDGTAWSVVDLSACNDPNLGLHRLWTPAPGVLFAAGFSKIVRLENTTCTAWSLGNGNNLTVSSLWAASASDAWATVSGDGVWRLVGGTWTKMHADNYEDVWGAVAGTTYAVYVRHGGALRRYDGQSWSTEITPEGVGFSTAIWGVSPSEVYIGGISADFTTAQVVRYDGASTWTTILTDEPLLTASSSEVWAGWTVGDRTYVGVRKGQQGVVLAYDGVGWSDLEAPTIEARALWASAAGDVVVATGLPALAILDGNIRLDRKPELGTHLSALWAIAPDDVLVIEDGARQLHRFNGATWEPETDVTEAVDVGAIGDKAFAVGSNGLFVRSSNVWSPVSGSTAGRSLWPIAEDDVWVLDPATRTLYRWRTGNIVAVPSFPTTNFTYLNDIWGSSANDVFVVGGRNAGSSFTIEPLIQHWNGIGWTEMTLPPVGRSLGGVWGTSATDVFAFAGNGVIHFDGATWSALPAIPDSAVANALWGSEKDLFVGTSRGVFRFDGQQWSPVETGAPGSVSLISGIGDSIFFVDGLGGWHQLIRLMTWW